jgi:glycosyltransferase involved in cell wall biosynthesis
MKLSVLVPVYNRAEALGHCLAALAAQTLPRDAFEVIVCDDGSEDNPVPVVAEWTERLDLRLLRLPHRNRAAALNAGAQEARGDVIVFTDADMVPTPTLLEKHAAFHRDDPRPESALLGHMDWHPSLGETRFMRYIVEDTAWQFGYTHLQPGTQATWGYFYGGNVSVKRAFLFAHGLHDESFARAEDIELGYRLCRAGLTITYDATAVNHHRHFVTVRDFARRNRNVGAALVHFARRHPELSSFLPVFAAPTIALDAERRGVRLEDLVRRSAELDRFDLSPAEDEERQQLWEFTLWAWLGAGVRDAVRADVDAAPLRMTVIVPGSPEDPPIPPTLSRELIALEQRGFEFLLFRVGRDGSLLSPSACLDRDVLQACHSAAAIARGRQLCFMHRADLDPARLLALADAVEREGGLAVEATGAGRDAIGIPRPFFFECGGFEHMGQDAAFAWRLTPKVELLGARVWRRASGATAGRVGSIPGDAVS